MPQPEKQKPQSPFQKWFLESSQPEQSGFYEEEEQVKAQHHTQAWWKVMCLTGVDYFSTLGYQPGIAALAAGALSPVATFVLVLVTLFGALPMYRRVAEESPHGDGSLSMLAKLFAYWPSKILVLILIGFVATGFVITMTLSAADATAHLIENPLLKSHLEGKQVIITLVLLGLLGAVFLKGFKEAIGLAVILVIIYLILSAVVIGSGISIIAHNPELLNNWWSAVTHVYARPLDIIGAALLVFPALALGLSGFETGVVVMPLIKGDPTDTQAHPTGRIRNAKKLLTVAALIMSVLLMGSSIVTTVTIPRHEFWAVTSVTTNVSTADIAAGKAVVNVPLDNPIKPKELYAFVVPANKTGNFTVTANTVGGIITMPVTVEPQGSITKVTASTPAGHANGRALAYMAHNNLGEGFGSIYDISTIFILWFAGASAMAGLLNIVPRYLPRYGMAPDWAKASRPLTLVFTGIAALVTILFNANVDAQAGAYATGVLALMTSAAIAVFLTELQRKHNLAAAGFGLISLIFIYTSFVTIKDRPEGLWIALAFIFSILIVSTWSRISRSTELRVQRVIFDEVAKSMVETVHDDNAPVRFIANRLNAGDTLEYQEKALEVRIDNHLGANEAALFLEVEIVDASDFIAEVQVKGIQVGQYSILRAKGNSVPNTIAAVLLHLRSITNLAPHVYFEWSEKSPTQNALRFILAGEGDIPPLTREILRIAEPDIDTRPKVHVGG